MNDYRHHVFVKTTIIYIIIMMTMMMMMMMMVMVVMMMMMMMMMSVNIFMVASPFPSSSKWIFDWQFGPITTRT